MTQTALSRPRARRAEDAPQPARNPHAGGAGPAALSRHVASITSEAPHRRHVEGFVGLCHRIATAYLRQRVRANTLNPSFFGVSLGDLALDCIADLFGRDEAGRFGQLDTYFRSIRWCSLTEHELLVATRRLVFSSVSHSLMRRYRAMDPSLSRLIRNLKNAVKRYETLELRRRGGELWLFAAPASALDGPVVAMPPELLEGHLASAVHVQARLDDMLDAFMRVLGSQTAYVRGYPLTGLAQVIRAATVRVGEATETAAATATTLQQEALQRMLAASVEATKAALHRSYVARRKVNAATYDLYFEVVYEQLERQYLTDDGTPVTNQQALQARLGDLSLEVYRAEHRSMLEYFVKLSRAGFIDRARAEWA